MVKIPTRSRIKGKTPILVSVDKIRPTNPLVRTVRKTEYSPILLVKADDNYFYIVDGNHRFFKKIFSRDKNLEAWVLEEDDRQKVEGKPLPQFVREWKEGRISLKKLTNMAMEAYRNIEIDVGSLLPNWPASKDNEIRIKANETKQATATGKDPIINPAPGKRYTVEEFIIKAVKALPKPPYVGMRVRCSGFQEAFIKYFGKEFDANTEIARMIAGGKLTSRLSPGGIMVYIPGTDPREKRVNQTLEEILS